MLEKPAILDETIIACLQAEYGLRILQIAFLPLGGDLSTAVYRADADNGRPYFCRLKFGDFDEISVELPNFLSEQGIAQIIAPIATTASRLWATFDEFTIILYPFITGTSGFDIELTERQWADFGAALKQIHAVNVPPALIPKIQQEHYSPEWRDQCKNAIQRLDTETFDDPVTTGLLDYFRPKRAVFLELLGHAERLAHTLAARLPERVLCHSDIHPGNLFIDSSGTLFIVDWDYPVLAPKERDLMFIGGGQGYVARTAEEEETLFYRNYGPDPIDPVAMAYYRCERNIVDFCVESTRIFSSTGNARDRAFSLEIITWLFLPGGSIEQAYRSLAQNP